MADEIVPARDLEPRPSRPSVWRRIFGLSLLANRYPELHGVRVMAILCVLQWHVTSILWINGMIRSPAQANFALRSLTLFFGMDLFFVLSGFLIGSMLLHATAEREAHGGSESGGILRFYARRAFRTFPLYYVVLVFLAWHLPFTAIKRANLPYEFVYLTNYRSLVTEQTVTMLWGWSLCVEEHFYFAVPFLVAALRLFRSHRSRLAFLGAIWSLGIVVRLAIFYSQPSWTEDAHFQSFYIKTHTRFDTLIVGIVLAYLQFHLRDEVAAWLSRRGPQLATVGIALACFFLLLFPHEIAGKRYYLLYRLFCWGTFTSLLYLTSLPLLFHGDGPIKRFLSRPFFLGLATLGYGTYLVHIPVFEEIVLPFLKYFHASGWSFAGVWVLGLVAMWGISLALSYVLHLLVEKPALALRDRLVP